MEVLVKEIYRGGMRKYGVITLLFVFSLLFVVGCEDEPVKVVKTKPKPSADDWIGTWEYELIGGEPFANVLNKNFKESFEDEDGPDDIKLEDFSVSTSLVFSNNGTFFFAVNFDFTMILGGDEGLVFKLKWKTNVKMKGVYAISSYTYTFIDESSEITLDVTPKRIWWLDVEKMERDMSNDFNSSKNKIGSIGESGRWSLKRGKLLLTETEDDGEVTISTLKRVF